MSCHSHARVDNAREPMSSVLETAPPPVHHPRDPPALTDYERRADVTHTANQRPVIGVGETTRPAFGYMSSQLLHGMAKSPKGGGARAPNLVAAPKAAAARTPGPGTGVHGGVQGRFRFTGTTEGRDGNPPVIPDAKKRQVLS